MSSHADYDSVSETELYSPSADLVSRLLREYGCGNTHLAFYHELQLNLYCAEQGRRPPRVMSGLLERRNVACFP